MNLDEKSRIVDYLKDKIANCKNASDVDVTENKISYCLSAICKQHNFIQGWRKYPASDFFVQIAFVYYHLYNYCIQKIIKEGKV